MNRDILLAIAAVVIIYLLFKSKKVSELARNVAWGAIPVGLTTTPPTTTGSTTLPGGIGIEGAGTVVNINGQEMPSTLGLYVDGQANQSGSISVLEP